MAVLHEEQSAAFEDDPSELTFLNFVANFVLACRGDCTCMKGVTDVGRTVIPAVVDFACRARWANAAWHLQGPQRGVNDMPVSVRVVYCLTPKRLVVVEHTLGGKLLQGCQHKTLISAHDGLRHGNGGINCPNFQPHWKSMMDCH